MQQRASTERDHSEMVVQVIASASACARAHSLRIVDWDTRKQVAKKCSLSLTTGAGACEAEAGACSEWVETD